MPIRKVKIEGVAADDRDSRERQVVSYLVGVEYFFAGPLIDARCARARSAELWSGISGLAIV